MLFSAGSDVQLIPFYGLVMLFARGQAGPNKYGPDPKDPATSLSEFDRELLTLQPEGSGSW